MGSLEKGDVRGAQSAVSVLAVWESNFIFILGQLQLPCAAKIALTLGTVELYDRRGFTQFLCHVQAVWVNMSTFYLSDDCSLWAQNGPQSGIGVFLAAGSTLQNSVTLNMDQGGATVKLPLVDKQDTRRKFPSSG